MNQDPKPEIESKVEESLKALSGKYAIIGKWSIRSWKTWLIIGVVAGVLGGATYVANKNVARLESEQSAAGTLQPKITVISPNGGETLPVGYFYSVNWRVENSDKVGNNAFMLGIEEKYKIGPFNRTRIVYTENLSQAISSLRITNNVQTATYNYQWKVPSNIKAGKYSAVIYLSNRLSIRDKSDKEFNIIQPFVVNPIIQYASINGGLGASGYDVSYSWTGLPPGIYIGDNLEFTYNDGLMTATASAIVRQDDYTKSFYAQVPWSVYLPHYGEKNYYQVKKIPVSTIQPSITVLSPNGGEVLEKGKPYKIVWIQQNVNMVSIGYKSACRESDLSSSLDWIATGISTSGSQGSYDWNVSVASMDCSAYNTQPLYKIEIIAYKINVGSTIDQSNAPFSIVNVNTQPSITVLSPNGGERFVVGRTYTIRWKSTGDIKGVALYLIDKDGNVSQSNLTNITGNTGEAKWKVPATTPGNYKIQIDGCSAINCTVDGVLSSATMIATDQSNAAFNIR